MKLKLRLIFGYYKTKFNTIAGISPRLAAAAAFRLFCTPYSGKPKRKEPSIFHKAKKLQFDFNGIVVRGFQWTPAKPGEKTILICHGFDSSSYKFEKFVHLFLREGMNVLAFDAPGHGISDGKIINAMVYRNLIIQIEKLFGPVKGIMAHSLGGLAAALAMEEINDPSKKIVLIAPATETITAIENFFHFIRVNDKTQKAFEGLIEETGSKPVSWYSVTRAVQTFSSQILWLHDEDDPVCPYEDTLPVQKMNLPHTTFITTKGLGHSTIYRDNKVQKMIADFFSK